MTRGSCLCGVVQYEIGAPQTMIHCHCSMCRKHHGTAFATFVSAPIGEFRWLQGQEAIRTWRSSAEGTRSFCRHCGSVTPVLLPDAGITVCPAGNLEDPVTLQAQAHWFVGSKAAWHEVTDSLPQFDEYPPEFGASSVARPPVATSSGITSGSCLCGVSGYEVTGTPIRMVHCHCSRCRRGRSAAHATNLIYNDTAFRWTRGQERVREYKIPEARYFTVAFCEQCGSSMPRLSPERHIVVIPAGSLDSDPGVRPQFHIFAASKAAWFPITDELPQFEAGPP